jgi:comEA protein
MTPKKHEGIILAVIVLLLIGINVIGYCKRARWERQYVMIIDEIKSQVSINNATKLELESLPGIGPSLAQRIIDYRADHGVFRTLEGLKHVNGIGEKKYRSILPYIKL